MPAIEARNLGKTYQEGQNTFEALRNVSFAAEPGQFVSIVGPSGCGKSTLLLLLACLMKPTSGAVLVGNEQVAKPSPGKVSVIFQDATLLPWKTARQNVEFPLRIRGVSRDEARSRAKHNLELVGLSDFAERMPHELSGGMKQRVAIARGLAQNPEIVLMDEPYGALDEQTRTKMGFDLLEIWSATRKTVVLITHSLTEAIFLSDVIYVMAARPGRIVHRIEVGLERPRSLDMLGSATFGAIRNRLWRHLTDGDEQQCSVAAQSIA